MQVMLQIEDDVCVAMLFFSFGKHEISRRVTLLQKLGHRFKK